MNNQSRWLIVLLTGFITFISSYGSFLIEHSNGLDLGHALLIGASALSAMLAALKFQLPRNDGPYKDRVSDSKLNQINKEDSNGK